MRFAEPTSTYETEMYLVVVASAVGWLDASAADERRMREVVRLFAQRESRDELGIGQIRDMLSNLLFPGISVVQTRARYFLIVPWLIAESTKRRRSDERIIDTVQRFERRLIRHVLDDRPVEDHEGLIGRLAGHRVKILPSTIYWSGLSTMQIVPGAAERADLDDWLRDCRSPSTARRLLADVPVPPDEFPKKIDGGFDLTSDESVWLRDRIVTATGRETLLSHLAAAAAPQERNDTIRHLWDDPACEAAPTEVRQVLEHAEHFSLMVEGAALLYNLLLADHAESLGFNVGQRDDLQPRLDDWCNEVTEVRSRLSTWVLDDLWQLDPVVAARIGLATRAFVAEWVDLVRSSTDLGATMNSAAARDLIRLRETRQKRGQSRFTNERLLASWEGEAGTGRLDYRWPVVHRLLTDIHEGLERVPA